MRKNKKILSLILAITLILTITACGNKELTPTINSESISTEMSLEDIIETETKDSETTTGELPESTVEQTTEEPEPEPKTHTVTLIAVGDNLIHSTVIKSGEQSDGTYNYDNIYSNIKNEISYADIKIINQETVLVKNPEDYSGYPTFGSPYAIGDATINA